MARTLKELIILITPPIFTHLAKRLLGNHTPDKFDLVGEYHNWDEAMAASTGYASEIILEKTKVALLKVKNDEAVYERDSVLFDKIQYTWPVLAGLMWVAAQSGGRLNVLDYGGSLGTTYFQNRVFLSTLAKVRWNIVEQPGHVETGKIWFEDDRLHFYENIANCLAENKPNVVLLGGVLQCLARPYDLLNDIQKLPVELFIIDRTPFWDGPVDKLYVQKVPSHIYPASYPSWIFSLTLFRSHLDKDWEVIEEFESIDRLSAPVKVVSKGFILVRKNPHLGRIPK